MRYFEIYKWLVFIFNWLRARSSTGHKNVPLITSFLVSERPRPRPVQPTSGLIPAGHVRPFLTVSLPFGCCLMIMMMPLMLSFFPPVTSSCPAVYYKPSSSEAAAIGNRRHSGGAFFYREDEAGNLWKGNTALTRQRIPSLLSEGKPMGTERDISFLGVFFFSGGGLTSSLLGPFVEFRGAYHEYRWSSCVMQLGAGYKSVRQQ